MQRLGANIVSQVAGLGDRPHLEALIGAVKVMLDGYCQDRFDRVMLFISDGGVVVGSSEVVPGAGLHAFHWEDGVMTDLGTLGDDPYAQALAINEDRQVVGVSYSEGFATCRAFIWEHGVMTDLNDLAPDYSGQLCAANDINDLGQITGEAVQQGTGRSVAFLAGPLAADSSTSDQRAAAETHAHAAPTVSWDVIQSIMTRSGVRREDLGR